MKPLTEYEELAAERERVGRKLSARGIAFRRWFERPREPDHFVWHDVGALIGRARP